MTFIDYLKSQGIDNNSPGAKGIVCSVIAVLRPEITYREASLIFTDIPGISDMFEALWYGYEDALDRQNYEIERKSPEDVYTITWRVLAGLAEGKVRKAMITTFHEYIKNCMYRDEPKADFKEDVLRDKTFPKKLTASADNYERIRRYLFLRRACSEAIQAFNECWGEYYKDQTGTEFPERLYR